MGSASTGGNQYCAGRNKDGSLCQRKVAEPGSKIVMYCWQHRRAETKGSK